MTLKVRVQDSITAAYLSLLEAFPRLSVRFPAWQPSSLPVPDGPVIPAAVTATASVTISAGSSSTPAVPSGMAFWAPVTLPRLHLNLRERIAALDRAFFWNCAKLGLVLFVGR